MENIMSSKLFTTRQGTVLLGVIAAVIAAIALIVYLNHYRNSVNAERTVSVLVAQRLIQKGTPGDVIRTTAGLYRSTGIPKGQVETGAIVSPATLAGKVALTDISPGQQLTAADFGPATGSVATKLDRNQRAVVVSLGSPQQVGGQIAAAATSTSGSRSRARAVTVQSSHRARAVPGHVRAQAARAAATSP